MSASRKGGGAVVRWDEEIARRAQMQKDAERHVLMGNQISLQGGIMQFNGQPIKDNVLDAIVLDGILMNTLYKDKFKSGEARSPICYAFARDEKELKPHEKSFKPQHPQCKGCWANEFDTNDRGGKACQNRRRLAIIPADFKMSAKAIEEAHQAYLAVPVTSVKGWAMYVNKLADILKKPTFAVITTISVVPDGKTQFKLVFEPKEEIKGGPDIQRAILARVTQAEKNIAFAFPDYKEGEGGGRGGGKKGEKKGNNPRRKF